MAVGRRRGWRSCRGWRTWVVLCAAWLVALQAVAATAAGVAADHAASLAAHASPADPFGGVICTHAGPVSAPEHPDDPGGHRGLPACCLLGCTLSGVALAPPPAFALIRPVPRRAVALAFRPAAEPRARRPERTPRSTRGPPAA